MAMLAVPAVEATAGRVAAGQAGKAAAKKGAARKSSGSAARRPGGKPQNLPSTGPDGAPSTGAKPKPFKPASPEPVIDSNPFGALGELGGQAKTLATDAQQNLSLTPPSLRKLNAADASGFAFGLVAYCLFINYLRYGPAGVRGWIAAKFVNKPLTGVPK